LAVRRTSGILSLLPIPAGTETKLMIDQQRRNILPELVRSACDPWLDAMTRTSIFDALRQISGENFGDDALLWRACTRRSPAAMRPSRKHSTNR